MSSESHSTSPITHERSLHCSAEHAFATYAGRIGEWWEPRYTANAETLEAVTVPGDGLDTGCTMRFAHGGWTDANASAREKFGDWPVLLDRFVSLADSARR